MSGRLLKKVLNEKHLPQQLSEEDEDQLNEEDEDSTTNRSSINPFDLLNDRDSDSEPQGDESKSTNETLTGYDDKEESSSLKDTAAVLASNSKSKKKKKKKNKDGSVANKTGGEKELDLILEDLSLDVKSSGEQHVSTRTRAVNAKDQNKSVKQNAISVLQVDPKYLNAENELRRIFGSKVVKSFETSNQASSSRQMRGVRRGHYNLRKTVLVTPANYWPRWDGSLSMQFLEIKNGYNYFRLLCSFLGEKKMWHI